VFFNKQCIACKLQTVVPVGPTGCVLEIYGETGEVGSDQQVKFPRQSEMLRNQPCTKMTASFE
jgi:hypothetical protein